MERQQALAREEILVNKVVFAIHSHDCKHGSLCQNCSCMTSLFDEAKVMFRDNPSMKNKIAKIAINEIAKKMDMIFELYQDTSKNHPA